MKTSRTQLESGLGAILDKLKNLQQQTLQAIQNKQTTVSKLEAEPYTNKPSLLAKLFKDTPCETHHDLIDSLVMDIKRDQKALKDIDQIQKHYQEVVHFIRNVSGFFD